VLGTALACRGHGIFDRDAAVALIEEKSLTSERLTSDRRVLTKNALQNWS
jgi:hypothetical protein